MSKKVIKLENWSVVFMNADVYTPPEDRKRHLRGIADHHPRLGEDVPVTTSAIISAKGRVVKTEGGKYYQLGKPDENYLVYLSVSNLKLDEANPVKVR